jgi:hypothetical protein
MRPRAVRAWTHKRCYVRYREDSGKYLLAASISTLIPSGNEVSSLQRGPDGVRFRRAIAVRFTGRAQAFSVSEIAKKASLFRHTRFKSDQRSLWVP